LNILYFIHRNKKVIKLRSWKNDNSDQTPNSILLMKSKAMDLHTRKNVWTYLDYDFLGRQFVLYGFCGVRLFYFFASPKIMQNIFHIIRKTREWVEVGLEFLRTLRLSVEKSWRRPSFSWLCMKSYPKDARL
jgi:hypothetical protein